jgi:DnaJ-class molecular chaperone
MSKNVNAMINLVMLELMAKLVDLVAGFGFSGDFGDLGDIFGDLFGDMFGGGGGRRRRGGGRSRARKGEDLMVNLNL